MPPRIKSGDGGAHLEFPKTACRALADNKKAGVFPQPAFFVSTCVYTVRALSPRIALNHIPNQFIQNVIFIFDMFSFRLLAIANISIILIVLATRYIRDDDETIIKPQEALLWLFTAKKNETNPVKKVR